MHESGLVVAAGAVTLRRRRGTTEVLLVHRPRYDDWSFPKGKLDPGEGAHAAAVREVQEETGLSVRLGPPLSPQVYAVGSNGDRPKMVHYWVARCTGDDDVSAYRPNDEIDDVRWFSMHDVAQVLSYERDREMLREARPFRRRSAPLIMLRHAEACPRKQWGGDDRGRPLTDEGVRQAERLVPLLSAYGVRHVVSSSSQRCVQSVAPYAHASGHDLELTHVLSEQDATPHAVFTEMDTLLDLREPTVVCGHRPVLPMMFQALGLEPTPLEPGDAVVLHHRHGRIVAVDRVSAPDPA